MGVESSHPCVAHLPTFHCPLLQRLAWAVPKILAFVVVTGTHYQFLWYAFPLPPLHTVPVAHLSLSPSLVS